MLLYYLKTVERLKRAAESRQSAVKPHSYYYYCSFIAFASLSKNLRTVTAKINESVSDLHRVTLVVAHLGWIDYNIGR